MGTWSCSNGQQTSSTSKLFIQRRSVALRCPYSIDGYPPQGTWQIRQRRTLCFIPEAKSCEETFDEEEIRVLMIRRILRKCKKISLHNCNQINSQLLTSPRMPRMNVSNQLNDLFCI